MPRKSRSVPRPLSPGERWVDLWLNWLAIAAAFIAVAILMTVAVSEGGLARIFSLLVYSCGLLAMLICSALYNGGHDSPHHDLLRRLDHAAIFVMIAATYTPFLVMLDAAWSRGLLVYVWSVAALGVALKLIWPYRFERLSVVLYLFLGWTIVVAIKPLVATISLTAMILLAAGGVLYSVGVIFHLWERLPYQQPVWHGFVVAAAACHYAAVLGEIALPGTYA